MKGYIKLHRKLMNSPVWQDPLYLKLWMYCLMKATHTERDQLVGNQLVKLQPGQFVTGRNVLASDLNKGMKPDQKVSERTWYRYLENLEKWQMLTIKKTNRYSVVSVVKWSEYQQDDQQLTNSCPSNDQQLSTNKNVKNVKNDKKYSRKQVYDENSLYYKMTDYFYKLILKNNPQHKRPNYQNWSDDFRKLVELDKRDKDQVRKVMEFVQTDDFEMKNVLSPNKLRERYDQLFMKANKVKVFKKPNYEVNDGERSNAEHSNEIGDVQLFR